jgi:hypothetical protein
LKVEINHERWLYRRKQPHWRHSKAVTFPDFLPL